MVSICVSDLCELKLRLRAHYRFYFSFYSLMLCDVIDILKVAISGTQIWLSEQKPNPLALLFGQGLTEREGGLKHVSDRA